MREIQELIKTSSRYKKAIMQQTLKSKKNSVAYVTLKNKPRVLKWYVPGFKDRMKNEYSILKKGSSKINMPSVYEMDEKNNVIVMNYIIGENLCDIINKDDASKSEKQRLMKLLAQWFYNFHNFFKKEEEFYIHGDPTLRNFILTDKIWGVDFEETRQGKVVEDIAGVCASVLTTDPMFSSEKFELCNVFIDSYIELAPGRITSINDELSYALLQKIQWRPDDEEVLRKFSKRIKEKGLK